MSYLSFLPGHIYHIYNRGNNRENIFLEERNYLYFLQLYKKYISPIADTLAYSLLPNHYHFSLQIKEVATPGPFRNPSQCFSNMFNAYTKAINKAYNRRGSLFEKHLKRKVVVNDDYLRTLIVYIHRNPQTHGLTTDFRAWPYSSYQTLVTGGNALIRRRTVLKFFGDPAAFVQAHLESPQELPWLSEGSPAPEPMG